ncbi:MAG: hypothetical protein ACYTF0_00855 [Planctomycetota bacterium]
MHEKLVTIHLHDLDPNEGGHEGTSGSRREAYANYHVSSFGVIEHLSADLDDGYQIKDIQTISGSTEQYIGGWVVVHLVKPGSTDAN